jgi:chemotaxis protein MotB
MALKRKPTEAEDDGGAPEWMVTFSDCMTLLLTFFVLLISFSSFDEKDFRKMESALAEGFSSVSLSRRHERNAVHTRPRIVYKQELERGSEAPTEEGQYASNPNESLDFMDFQNQKVLLVPSDKVFWGRGTLVSSHGRRLFADIAALIKAMPNRIVVSEYGLDANEPPTDAGLDRAWQIARFLAKRHGIDQTRFSISSGGTVPFDTIRASGLFASDAATADRVVEITILDRSTYR